MGCITKRGFTFLLAVVVISGIYGAEKVHILAAGETLYSLSRTYGIEVEVLLSENGITDPSSLSVGTRLVIPGTDSGPEHTPSASAEIYTVAAGDTYYSIARKHGLGVDELLALNGRNVGRVLRIGETLVVSAGDGTGPPPPERVPVPERTPGSELVEVDLPGWPVAGLKRPLDGKLVGVSIEAEPRSYVYAVSGGNVVWTGPYRGFGNVVLVDSGGYIYLYGGNEDLFVNVGQDVAAGNRIGRLGSTGPVGGKREMIFSVFREGVPVSPEEAPRG